MCKCSRIRVRKNKNCFGFVGSETIINSLILVGQYLEVAVLIAEGHSPARSSSTAASVRDQNKPHVPDHVGYFCSASYKNERSCIINSIAHENMKWWNEKRKISYLMSFLYEIKNKFLFKFYLLITSMIFFLVLLI